MRKEFDNDLLSDVLFLYQEERRKKVFKDFSIYRFSSMVYILMHNLKGPHGMTSVLTKKVCSRYYNAFRSSSWKDKIKAIENSETLKFDEPARRMKEYEIGLKIIAKKKEDKKKESFKK